MPRLVHNVQKKQHKERSQVALRQKLGLLEKKKDYRLRADDAHKKKAALKILKNKADNHNPDEYYHAMTKQLTDRDGVAVASRGEELLLVAQALLLKTQDVSYIRTVRTNEQARIAREKQALAPKAVGKHTVFVDSADAAREFDPAQHFNTDESLISRRENRLRMDQLQLDKPLAKLLDADTRAQLQKDRMRQLQQLKQRVEREKELREVELRMEYANEVMKKGAKKKVYHADGTTLFKWAKARKR